MYKISTLLFAINVFLSSSIYSDLYRFEGEFEDYNSRPLELISKFIPENPNILEAGGHYGTDTIKMAQQWPKGQIYSFEPNPNAFKILSEATQNLTNVNIFNLALNDYNGTAILNVCYGTTGDQPIFEGASSLLDASPEMEIHYQGPKVEVSCVRLEDWCKKNGIFHIDFMWLDLEGIELQILKSAKKILKNTKVIYTETNFYPFRKGTTQYKDLKNFLEKNGFVLLAHWYHEGYQGNAIFIKKTVYQNFLKNQNH